MDSLCFPILEKIIAIVDKAYSSFGFIFNELYKEAIAPS